MVRGLGLFGVGDNASAAAVTADLAEANVEVIADAEGLGRYQCVAEADLFDIEYWSLEQAKLGRGGRMPLAGHVVVVTGAAGAIGRACAQAFRACGADMVLFDLDEEAVARVAREVGGLGVRCDVTDDASVERAFERVVTSHGGVDVVVSNAGAAFQGRIGEVDDSILRRSFEINFFSHQRVARAATGVMRRQGTGGCLLFNASKQALNPGRDFGPYGLPKAATLALAKQYAIDYGSDGIRSNVVNADRIRSGLLTPEMIRARCGEGGLCRGVHVREPPSARGRGPRRGGSFRCSGASRQDHRQFTVDGGNIEASPR